MRAPATAPAGPDPVILTGSPAEVLDRLDPRVLTRRERGRRSALRHPADRDGFAAAHLLIRECVAAVTGRAWHTLRLVQRCPVCGSADHGRPAVAGLPDIHVSLARTRGAVMAGAGRRPLGVDVERVTGAAVDPAALAIALTPAEAARVTAARRPDVEFLRHWVRKEALVKIGAASLDTLTGIAPAPVTREGTGDGPRRSGWRDLHIVDWTDPRLDAVLAVACPDPDVRPALSPLPSARPA